MNILIKINPISGPTITRPIEEIKDVLKESSKEIKSKAIWNKLEKMWIVSMEILKTKTLTEAFCFQSKKFL